MMKTLLAMAAVAALLTATGCCLPLHHGRHSYYSSQWSDSSRPAQPTGPSQHRPGY